MKGKKNCHIRWMKEVDISNAVAIECANFDYPWSKEDFQHYFFRAKNCISMVIEMDKRVVGYMIYKRDKNSLQIINFAVHLAYRNRGIGTAQIEKLKGKLRWDKYLRLNITVRETALGFQLFLKKHRFQAYAVERDYFGDTGECGYHMRYDIRWPRDMYADMDVLMPRNNT